MDEILRSNARAMRVFNWTVAAVAAVGIAATASSVLIMTWTQSIRLAIAVPSAAIAVAVVAAALVQRGAVRRHKALCDAGRRH